MCYDGIENTQHLNRVLNILNFSTTVFNQNYIDNIEISNVHTMKGIKSMYLIHN